MAHRSSIPPPRIAAHLIVGSREEALLPALLESIGGACAVLIVNDNAPHPSPHDAVLRNCRFAREGRMIVDRSPFTDFATARNLCLRLHHEVNAGDWVAFVDADEVHGERVNRIARNLALVPDATAIVEGYTWHMFATFDWYMSIERRMMFFRFAPHVRWEGAVHEQLRGLDGRRLVLPYVYAHYGWVVPARSHAQKGRQYSSLGAPGQILAEPELEEVRLDTYFEFAHRWRHALRFRAKHPPAAQPIIAQLRRERREDFALADMLVARHQRAGDRLRNAMMTLNYEQRWRSRALNPLALRMLLR